MKTHLKSNNIVSFCMILMALYNCQNESNNAAQNSMKPDCENICSAQFIDSLANEILSNHHSKTIWNLSSVDTAGMKTYEDYFVSESYTSKLIILQGEAGISAGNANKLFIILTCNDAEIRIDWYGQEGDLFEENFRDLDGDGIKEIIVEKGMMWMGACEDFYEILSFKNGERNVLYEARSYSVIDCGGEDFQGFQKGDTLEIQIESKLFERKKSYFIELTRFIKIHNGGETYEEVVRRIKEKRHLDLIEL